jgi:hypothetical protein
VALLVARFDQLLRDGRAVAVRDVPRSAHGRSRSSLRPFRVDAARERGRLGYTAQLMTRSSVRSVLLGLTGLRIDGGIAG